MSVRALYGPNNTVYSYYFEVKLHLALSHVIAVLRHLNWRSLSLLMTFGKLVGTQ